MQIISEFKHQKIQLMSDIAIKIISEKPFQYLVSFLSMSRSKR